MQTEGQHIKMKTLSQQQQQQQQQQSISSRSHEKKHRTHVSTSSALPTHGDPSPNTWLAVQTSSSRQGNCTHDIISLLGDGLTRYDGACVLHSQSSSIEASTSTTSTRSSSSSKRCESRLHGIRERIDQQESVLRCHVQNLDLLSTNGTTGTRTTRRPTVTPNNTVSYDPAGSRPTDRSKSCHVEQRQHQHEHEQPHTLSSTMANTVMSPLLLNKVRSTQIDITARRHLELTTRGTAPRLTLVTTPQTRSTTPAMLTPATPKATIRRHSAESIKMDSLTHGRDHWKQTAHRLTQEQHESQNQLQSIRQQLYQLRHHVQQSNAHIAHAMEPLCPLWPDLPASKTNAMEFRDDILVDPNSSTNQSFPLYDLADYVNKNATGRLQEQRTTDMDPITDTKPPPLRIAHEQILQLELEKTTLIGVLARAYVRMPLVVAVLDGCDSSVEDHSFPRRDDFPMGPSVGYAEECISRSRGSGMD